MSHDRFLSADTVGRKYQLIFLRGVSPA